eukprot:TRINITY_DN13167_c0_g1::TRINITY_DN13167_c0_g1_i1::g.31093::m.31093 TRINITY_DN13167_c0_g1::TRINITY_DN13167_c0_g1_i1::g.31093  ORF type:complete len:220 (+),score=8.79,PH/PF00169.24/0.0019 TRINITY_DN13167_c0_g1_i1:103-762(+)
METERVLKNYSAVYAGYLLKPAFRGLARFWISKFFILTRHSLIFKKSHELELDPVTTYVDLDEIREAYTLPHDQRTFHLALYNGQSLPLTAPTIADAVQWCEAIQKMKHTREALRAEGDAFYRDNDEKMGATVSHQQEDYPPRFGSLNSSLGNHNYDAHYDHHSAHRHTWTATSNFDDPQFFHSDDFFDPDRKLNGNLVDRAKEKFLKYLRTLRGYSEI